MMAREVKTADEFFLALLENKLGNGQTADSVIRSCVYSVLYLRELLDFL